MMKHQDYTPALGEEAKPAIGADGSQGSEPELNALCLRLKEPGSPSRAHAPEVLNRLVRFLRPLHPSCIAEGLCRDLHGRAHDPAKSCAADHRQIAHPEIVFRAKAQVAVGLYVAEQNRSPGASGL